MDYRPNNDGIIPGSETMHINTNPLAQGAQLLKLIQNVTKDWDTVIVLADHQAKLIKQKYDSAILAGFTEQQALDVCTKLWA